MRIIIVDDDPRVREPLVEWLRRDGFDADGAGSALEFYRDMATDAYDIAIIDIGLPDQSGLDMASWLRLRPGTGIVLLSGQDDVEERLKGFRSGADLYFTKPVHRGELALAIRSLGRRLAEGVTVPDAPAPQISAWFFDPVQWALQAPQGGSVKLTASEMTFIQLLLIQPGKAVPRDALRVELAYEPGKSGDQCLDALVRRLRRKIEKLSGEAAPIQTVHGRGYLFSAPLRLDRRLARVDDAPGYVAHPRLNGRAAA
jgi:two-component system, OmpR family, response regulator